MKISAVKIVYDSTDKEILKYPVDTLLDNIYYDLWNVIIKYLDYHPFIINHCVSNCPGYRPVKKNEFNLNKFLSYYFKNYSIPTLNNASIYDKNLIIDGHYLYRNTFGISCFTIANHKKISFRQGISPVIENDNDKYTLFEEKGKLRGCFLYVPNV